MMWPGRWGNLHVLIMYECETDRTVIVDDNTIQGRCIVDSLDCVMQCCDSCISEACMRHLGRVYLRGPADLTREKSPG